jgi:cell division protein FtsW (lipid II flippase)
VAYYLLVALTLLATWTWSEGHFRGLAAKPVVILPRDLDESRLRTLLGEAMARDPGRVADLLLGGGHGIRTPADRTAALEATASQLASEVRAFEEARRGNRRTGPLVEFLRAGGAREGAPGADAGQEAQPLPGALVDCITPQRPDLWRDETRRWILGFEVVAAAVPLVWVLVTWVRRRLLSGLARDLLTPRLPDGPGLMILMAVLGLSALGLIGLIAHTGFSMQEQESRFPVDLALRHLKGLVMGLGLFAAAAVLNRRNLGAPRWRLRGRGFSPLEVLAAGSLAAGLGLQQAAALGRSQEFLGLRGGVLLLFAIPLTLACLAARSAPYLDVRVSDLADRPWRRPLRTLLALGAVAVPLGVTVVCLAVLPRSDSVKDRGPLVQMAWAFLAAALMLLAPDSRREAGARTWLHRVFYALVALAAFGLIFAPWMLSLRAAAHHAAQEASGPPPLLEERLLARNVTWPEGVRHWDQAMRNWYEIAYGGVTGAGPGEPVRAAKFAHKDFAPALVAGSVGLLGGLLSCACLGLFLLGCRRRAGQETGVADPMPYLAGIVGVSVTAASLQSWAGTLALWPSSGVITPYASYGTAGLLTYGALAGLAAAPAAPLESRRPPWPGLGYLTRVLGALLLVVAAGHGVLVAQRRAILATSVKEPNPRPGAVPLILCAPQLVRLERDLQERMGRLLDRRGQPLEPARSGALALLLGGREVRGNRYQTSLARDSWPARLGLAEVLGKSERLDSRGVWFGRWLPTLQRPRERALAGVVVGDQPVHPTDVRTSLDLAIQRDAEQALAEELGGGPLRGEVVVLDAARGALRAVATYEPDPRAASGGLTPLFEKRRFGSSIKGALVYLALREGVAQGLERFVCAGDTLRLDGGRVIEGRCKAMDPRTGAKRGHRHGLVAGVEQALAISCNNFHVLLMSRLIAKVGPAGVAARFRSLGIPLEGKSLARHESDWITAAFGDGPMEGTVWDLAQAYARIYQATQDAEPSAPTGALTFTCAGWQPEAGPRAASAEERQAAVQVRLGMERVLRDPRGTSNRLGRLLVPGIRAWAKTGTSEIPTGKHRVQGFTAWFVMVVERPEPLVLAVRVPDGGFQNQGSRLPARIAQAFLRRHIPAALVPGG